MAQQVPYHTLHTFGDRGDLMKGPWHPKVSSRLAFALAACSRGPAHGAVECMLCELFERGNTVRCSILNTANLPCVRVQEDRRLCEVLQELGGCKRPGFSWSDVAKTLGGGRVGKSCRLRWCGILWHSPRSGAQRAECLPKA